MERMSENDGRALVELWRSSGLNASRFCREQGVALHKLKYWEQRVAHLDTPVGFIEVTQRVQATFPSESTVLVAPNGWRIETHAPLAEVIEAVR